MNAKSHKAIHKILVQKKIYKKITNQYYQNHKEKLWNEAHERY